MITRQEIQKLIYAKQARDKLFDMPPEARAAYDAANAAYDAAFRMSEKTPIVSDPSDKTTVDEKAREAAAL